MKLKNYIMGLVFLLFGVASSLAQEKTVSGSVTDIDNIPLPGASVLISGTTRGTSTDFDGNFSIEANVGDILIFSYVGYETQSITVGESYVINVTLSPDSTALDEVVITALGVRRKPDAVSSSNQVVKSEEIVQANNPNAVQGLAGKVSGLQINTTSTGVTPNTSIILRGYSSISGGNNALVVIDNVISTAGTLAEIDPNNIESINVMKGPSGAALYGSQGGNGVIIVTTKKGNKDGGKFTVDIKSSIAFETIAYLPQRQDRFGQGWEGEFDWTDQGAWGPEFDGSQQVVGIPYPGVDDWRLSPYEHIEDHLEPFFNTGITLQNSVSLSAGDQDSYLNITANKQDIEGLIPNDEYNKTFFSLNTSKRAGKWQIGAVVRYNTDQTSTSSINTYNNLSQTPTNVDITMFDSGDNRDNWTLYARSPYFDVNNIRTNTRFNRLEAQGNLQYFFNDNIDVLLRSSVNFSNLDQLFYNNGYEDNFITLGTDRTVISRFDKTKQSARNIYTDLIFNFNYDLTEKLNLTALLGANTTERRFDRLTLGGQNLSVPGIYSINNIEGDPDNRIQDEGLERDASVFVAPSFNYDDYLFLNLTGRYEGVSRLTEDNRWFFYYSTGLSFIPTKAFPSIKSDFLDKLKLSGSYTLTGNANGVNAYDINFRVNQAAGYPFSTGNSYIASTNVTQRSLVNEDVSVLEFNLNSDLLKINGSNRVTLDAAFYIQNNKNQILGTAPSYASGLSNATINVGETETKGFEVDLGLTPIRSNDFEWNLNLGYSTYETTVKKVTDFSDEILTNFYLNAAGGQAGTVGLYAIEGQEYPLIKGTAYTRDDEGRVVLDANGAPVRSSDLKVLGKVTPDYIINFATGFSYKGLRLNVVMDYRTGHSFYSNIANNLNAIGGTIESAQNGREPFLFPNSTIQGSGVENTAVLTGGTTPAQFQSYVTDNYGYFDENFVLDATAVKLRELSLSYDLPSQLLNNLPITKLQLGVSGRNLYTWLPRENRGYNDPEIGTGLGNFSQTPPTKFYAMSFNIIF